MLDCGHGMFNTVHGKAVMTRSLVGPMLISHEQHWVLTDRATAARGAMRRRKDRGGCCSLEQHKNREPPPSDSLSLRGRRVVVRKKECVVTRGIVERQYGLWRRDGGEHHPYVVFTRRFYFLRREVFVLVEKRNALPLLSKALAFIFLRAYPRSGCN